MKTEQHQLTNNKQKKCWKKNIKEWFLSFLGIKKSSDWQEFDFTDEKNRKALPTAQYISEHNLRLEVFKDKDTEETKIVDEGNSGSWHDKQAQRVSCLDSTAQAIDVQSENCLKVLRLLRENGILSNDEDWNTVDLNERLPLYIVSKCIHCWNHMYPDEAIDGTKKSLNELLDLIHSGFIGIDNREKLDDWFQEIAMELRWNVQSMEWLQNLKKYLIETKINIKREYEQLDKRIEKALQASLHEWQVKQAKSNIPSLQERINILETEKNALLTKLYEAEKNIQELQEEIKGKVRVLSEANEKIQNLSENLQEMKSEQERLRLENKKLDIAIAEQSEIISKRKQWSEGFFTKLEKIGTELNELVQKVADANPDSSIYTNLLKRVSINYETMKEETMQLKNLSDWEEGKIDIQEMIKRIQSELRGSLKRNGWINILTYLHCYSYVPQVATEFDNHALNILQLGRLYSLVIALLGEVRISIFAPRLLVDQFDNNFYDFKNSDTWINKFCPAIFPGDYEGRVFDLVQIGYQIQGEDCISYKPIVVYY